MTDTTFLRRNPTLSSAQIAEVLPDHFLDYYPNLVKLFEYYFEYLASSESPAVKNSEFFKTRDISEISNDLIAYMQGELLLGVDYFKGFSDPRDALKLSNWMYRSKGSRLSMEQFFRFFFGVTPEVVYTKNNVFVIDDSLIGYESQKYLTNDKLYQTFAILIKIPLGLNQWKEIYKLFVHPAGVYLGAQVSIQSVVNLAIEASSDEQVATEVDQNLTGLVDLFITTVTEVTGYYP